MRRVFLLFVSVCLCVYLTRNTQQVCHIKKQHTHTAACDVFICFIGQFTRSLLMLLSGVHACVSVLEYLGLRLADAVLCVCCMTRHAKVHTAAYNYRVSGGCGPSHARVRVRCMCVFVHTRPCLWGLFAWRKPYYECRHISGNDMSEFSISLLLHVCAVCGRCASSRSTIYDSANRATHSVGWESECVFC